VIYDGHGHNTKKSGEGMGKGSERGRKQTEEFIETQHEASQEGYEGLRAKVKTL